MAIVETVTNSSEILSVDAQVTKHGFAIIIYGKKYNVTYPPHVWEAVPDSVKNMLMENVTYAYTIILPLLLGKKKIKYGFPAPLFESTLFKNHLFDMTDCEFYDGVTHLEYLRALYNLEVEFSSQVSTMPSVREINFRKTEKKDSAIIPFSFGKESLATVAITNEIGVRPIPVYFSEPTHKYEGDRKVKIGRDFEKEFGFPISFVKNDPGMFRYGVAFDTKLKTELGWGPQSTIMALLSVPFAFAYGAKYILFGSEFLNNDYLVRKGWRTFISYDQTSGWTSQQSNMVRIMTGNRCGVYSVLEQIDEINVQYLLHHRYPEMGKFQFSCMGKKPLVNGGNWCYNCDKCFRMTAFSLACNIDPRSIGLDPALFYPKKVQNWAYFDPGERDYADWDMDFAVYSLYKRGDKSPYIDMFLKKRIKEIKSKRELLDHFLNLRPAKNLPPGLEKKITSIISVELAAFRQGVGPQKVK